MTSPKASQLALESAALTLLQIIKNHTILGQEQLKEEARTELDNPDLFDDSLTLAVKNQWIAESTTGWRNTKIGEDWLKDASGFLSTEDELLGFNDPQLKKPYDVAKLKVEQRTLSIFQALRKIEKDEIVMHPDFQRAFVWDLVKQSRLIESILIRIPLPAFYLDATDLVKWTVVDGLQRLTTLQRYCREQSFGLTGLEFLTELDGMRFHELPRKFQVLIEDDTQLIFNNLLPGTPVEAKFTIFSRVNTGGMQLTPQEIRHALNQGPITTLLKRLAASGEFLEATDGAIPSKRMADQELILRSLSFFHFGWESYQDFAEIDTFLVRTMARFNNEVNAKRLSELGAEFLLSASKVKSLFQRYAFRKFYERGGRRGPINKALFEVWIACVRPYDFATLERHKPQILDGFLNLLNTDSDFLKSITSSTGSFRAVKTRFETIEKLLREACE